MSTVQISEKLCVKYSQEEIYGIVNNWEDFSSVPQVEVVSVIDLTKKEESGYTFWLSDRDVVQDLKVAMLKKKFDSLVEQWHKERGATSFVSEMTNCESFKKILAMGEDVAVPFILKKMESEGDEPDHWFVALRLLTGENPVPLESRGKIREMAQAWFQWARDNNRAW